MLLARSSMNLSLSLSLNTPYCPTLLKGPLDSIQCHHRAYVFKPLLVLRSQRQKTPLRQKRMSSLTLNCI